MVSFLPPHTPRPAPRPPQCSKESELRQGAYTYRWQGLTFINTTARVKWTTPFKQIFWDLDGSLAGFRNGWVTPYYAFNHFRGPCSRRGPEYDLGLVCDNSTVVRRLQIDAVTPSTMDYRVRPLC